MMRPHPFTSTLCMILALSIMSPLTLSVDPCKKQRNRSFTSRVQVEFGMAHDKGLTPSEMTNMQDSFVKAYNSRAVVNENNSINCDITYVRRIDSCEIEADDSYFLYENGNQYYRRLFTFKCQARCKNCSPDMNLLDWTPKTNRRMLEFLNDEDKPEEENEEQDDEARSLFEIPAGTTCKCHRKANRRGPSQTEMVTSLEVEVEKKRQANLLQTVKAVLHVWQMEKVSCSTQTNDFESTVKITLDQTPRFIDLYALGNGFMDTYNENSLNFCDIYHRRVTGVRVRPIGANRRRLATSEWSVTLMGSCKGCGKTTQLFKDGRRRQLSGRLGTPETVDLDNREQQQYEQQDENERSLSWTATCYCPKYPVAKRHMKRGEFRPRYSRSIQETNYVGVSGVNEG